MHDCFWFLRRSGDELIQFQRDRLLHNWRKVGDQTNEYPRFKQMAARFKEELRQLEGYLGSLSPQVLVINQCELSYINHIEIGSGPVDLGVWFRGFSLAGVEADDVNIGIREVIRDDQQPVGRLTYEITTGIRPDGQRIIVLTLTTRGAPSASDIDSAMRFIAKGRELIVQRFAEITTEGAHKAWERRT